MNPNSNPETGYFLTKPYPSGRLGPGPSREQERKNDEYLTRKRNRDDELYTQQVPREDYYSDSDEELGKFSTVPAKVVKPIGKTFRRVRRRKNGGKKTKKLHKKRKNKKSKKHKKSKKQRRHKRKTHKK